MRFFHIKKILAAFFVCAVVFTVKPARAEVVDRVVAIVNDSIITASELNAATVAIMDRVKEKDRAGRLETGETRSKVLDTLIEQKLIKQAADSAGIDVSEKEIDNAVDDVKKQNRMTHEELLVALAESGLTYKEYREQLKEQIREVKFMNKEFRSKINLQPEEIESFYKQHLADFQGEPVYRILVIFIAKGKMMEERAKLIEKSLKDGEDFSALAKEFSDGPAASAGGDLGFLTESELSDTVKESALGLSPGQTSGLISKPEGAYFFQLAEKKPGEPRPLSQVEPMIKDKLFRKNMDNRFEFWLSEVKKTAHIEVRF